MSLDPIGDGGCAFLVSCQFQQDGSNFDGELTVCISVTVSGRVPFNHPWTLPCPFSWPHGGLRVSLCVAICDTSGEWCLCLWALPSHL